MAVLGADREGPSVSSAAAVKARCFEEKFESEDEVLKHGGTSWEVRRRHTACFRRANLADSRGLAGTTSPKCYEIWLRSALLSAERGPRASACRFRGQHGPMHRIMPPVRSRRNSIVTIFGRPWSRSSQGVTAAISSTTPRQPEAQRHPCLVDGWPAPLLYGPGWPRSISWCPVNKPRHGRDDLGGQQWKNRAGWSP